MLTLTNTPGAPLSIPTPNPAWMDSDLAQLAQLADTANRFCDLECLPNDARWRAQRRAERDIWTSASR